MLTNKQLVDIVFDQLKKLGFKPYNIIHPDGYFVFEGSKDSVTHFYLKGHGIWKHWRFGLWCNAEYTSDEELKKVHDRHKNGEYDDVPKIIQLFAQHDTWVDKFKPSSSALCVSYDAEDILEWLENPKKHPGEFWQIKDMLKMMCKHPFVCYAEYCGECAGYYSGSFIGEYIKTEWNDKWRKIRKNILKAYWLPWTKFKIFFSGKSRIIDSIELFDFEKECSGWSTDYLYEVRYVFTEAATEQEECDWLNRWWHRDKYGKYDHFSDCIVEVDMCRKVGKDEYYRYSEVR